MNFALLGDHPDALDMARAVAESGRHGLAVYAGPAAGAERLQRWQVVCQVVGDIEEALANPAIDAVIVGGREAVRFAQVRRAAQAEKHVLCAHPLDISPEAGYEADLQRRENGVVILPLLPEATHPAYERLAKLIAKDRNETAFQPAAAEGKPHPHITPAAAEQRSLRLIQMERWSADSPFCDDNEAEEPAIPGWEVLRLLAGEIVEVSAFAPDGQAAALEAMTISGRFEKGGMFQYTLLPAQRESRFHLTVFLSDDRAELLFADGWPGPALLSFRDENGEWKEQTWPLWNPWPRLLESFENAIADAALPQQNSNPARRTGRSGVLPPGAAKHTPSWQDEVRCLELDDAARRSVQRRRSSVLEYQEAVEEASFKGTMTLAGCGLLWLCLLLLIFAIWLPQAGLFILPLLAIFLVFQILRWFVFPSGRA